jgi:hypothetical protein
MSWRLESAHPSGTPALRIPCLQQAEGYRDADKHKLLSFRFGIDPGLAVLCYKLWALMALGFLGQARQVAEQVRAEIKNHGHAPTVATCTFFAVIWPELQSGEAEASEQHSAELVAYCTEKKVAQFRLFGTIALACARSMREPTQENIAALRDAIKAQHLSGAHLGDSFFASHLVGALLAAGDVSEADSSLRDTFSFVEQSGERFWLADLYRLDGLVKLKQPVPDVERAEASHRKAIEVARQQEARMHELRAATELARLWRETASDNDPRILIEPILAVIEDDEKTRDVHEARSFLLRAYA